MYGELPSDLTVQDETMGPPPSWYNMQTLMQDPSAYSPYYIRPGFYQQTLAGLGDREEEIEANPVERLRDLKYAQEMSKKIPREAVRYTEVEALSPMFRDSKPKYGFGNFTSGRLGSLLPTLSTLSAAVSGYHGYKRNKSIGWGAAWFVLGALGPVLVPTIAFAQGFAKPVSKRRKKRKSAR